MAQREESPMPLPVRNLLGRLVLVGRKSGEDIQTFPLDAEKVTIGRSEDADLRLYFADVSKIHAEVLFDQDTHQASLHVHGQNGLDHAPFGGVNTKYHPPNIIPLNEKDTFTIRKKIFRFEYAEANATMASPTSSPEMIKSPLPTVDSPKHNTVSLDSPTKVRAPPRRTSHRLSLVPSGKTFVPMSSPAKARRKSLFDTPRDQSGLRKQVDMDLEIPSTEDNEGMDEDDLLVGTAEGEDGDMVYVEVKENIQLEQAVNTPNPFLTPQPTRKAPLRNTSVAPRIRKAHLPQPAEPINKEETAAPQHIQVPATPRSIPLPPPSETPYAAAPPRVPPQIAFSTPRGPLTLHKALLMRSARKAWEENTRATGIDGAVEGGNVETTRRKSLGVQSAAKEGRKSTTPRPSLISPEEAEDEEEEEEEESVETPQPKDQLQWVYEDGQANVSYDESDSDVESYEADMSLDLPGMAIMQMTPPRITLNEEEAEEDEIIEEDNQDEDERYGHDASIESNEQGDEPVEGEEELEQAEQSTPLTTRILSRFFTPQVKRAPALSGPRLSLAAVGGGPARRVVDPSTPDQAPFTPQVNPAMPTGTRFAPTPGTMGKAARRVIVESPKIEPTEEYDQSVEISTPIKKEVDPRILAEAKKRRESLATPRALPMAPMSGFKDPVREPAPMFTTPSHPALRPSSPISESGEDEQSPTAVKSGMNDIRSRLNTIRRQSILKTENNSKARDQSGRRATVGFAVPSTPARPAVAKSSSYTGARPTTAKFEYQPTPGTPVVMALDGGENSNVSSLNNTPVSKSLYPALPTALQASTPSGQAVVHEEEEQEEEEEEEVYQGEEDISEIQEEVEWSKPSRKPGHSPAKGTKAAGPATPQYGLNKFFGKSSGAQPPKTPFMKDIGSLYPSLPKSSVAVPATPSFKGVKEMYHTNKVMQTPGMEGVAEMYAEDEEDDPLALGDNEEEEIIIPARKTAAKPSKRAATSTIEENEEEEESIIEAQSPKKKSTSSKAQAVARSSTSTASRGKRTAEAAPPATKKVASTTGRGKRVVESDTEKPTAAVPSRGSAPSRRKAVAVEPEVEVEAKDEIPVVKQSRTGRKPAAATASTTEDAPSKPSRGSRTIASSTSKEPASKPSRSRKVLAETDEQPSASAISEVEPVSAPSRRGKAATNTTAAASKTPTSTSTASRRKVAAAKVESGQEDGKENNSPEEPKSKMTRTPASRTTRKKVVEETVEPAVPVVTTRATRSRK